MLSTAKPPQLRSFWYSSTCGGIPVHASLLLDQERQCCTNAGPGRVIFVVAVESLTAAYASLNMTETIVCVGAVVRKGSRILMVRQAAGHSPQHQPVEPLSDWLVSRVFQNRLTVIPGNRENPFSPHHGFF